MGLYDILDQIIELLQQRKRLTYRLLQREFALDDETLEDLKDELIYGQQVARDEDDRVLVWLGEPEGPTVSASQPTTPAEPPSILQEKPTQVEPRRPEPHPPEAERRQLTVMFVDLVGSTELSSHLDPEDYREVVRAYQKACTEVIERFDGYVAQYLGDGLLVYFGYPHSHEDEAQRAVCTGLGMLHGMKHLNARLKQDKAIHLALRVGIHTGLVVIGEIGEGSRHEQLALGEVPNIAARIQGLAEADTVIISASTHQLVEGYFDCQELGEQSLRGVAEPIAVYRVLGESGVQSRLDVASTRGLTPLVGREQEVGILLDRWEQSRAGHGQVILLSGEAGIGKSRLVQALKEHVADEPHTRLECRSSPYYQNTALYPITDLLQRTLQFQPDDTPAQRLEKLEQELRQYRLPPEELVPLFAPLLSLSIPEDRYPPLNVSPQRQRQKTLETIVAVLLELAEQQPVLFVLEDLHWTDPTTLELLDLLIDQTPAASMLALLTCRPTFQPTWSHRSYLSEVTLNRLTQSQIARMAEHTAGGKRLPAEVLEQITEKTDGVPLFVEEMTKSVLESGALKDVDGHYELRGTVASLSIPSTLQDSLMARLDRLVSAKGIAQLAAVIGRQFSYDLLQAVSQLNAAALQRELGRLVAAELVYQRGLPPHATYIFKHALVQDAAYQSLLRSTRQGYHRCIAEVLAERFPETSESQPELLAHHYTQAGLHDQAVGYWQQAGEEAIERSAHVEAIVHLTQGLTLLTALPETPARLQQELDLRVALGPALIDAKGHGMPEVERTYARAQELCEQLGDTPQLFPVLRGLMLYHMTRGPLQTASQLGEQLLRLAQAQSDPALLMLAHGMLGQVLFYRGEPAAAQTHLTKALAIYTPQAHRALAVRYGVDLGVASGIWLAWALWQLGYPDQALQHSQTACTLAQEVSHPYSLGAALLWSAYVHQHRREARAAQEQAMAVTTLATEQGFASLVAWGTVFHGWALAAQGQHVAGVAEIRQGLAADPVAGGAKQFQPYFLGLLAEAYGEGGYPEEGLNALAEALAVMDTTQARYYGAELYRLQGTLLLHAACSVRHAIVTPEDCFQKALDIARHQQAKSLELRAATSLARLWQSQDKHQEAYDLLAPVYNWFTEGFDTADLKDAKKLLNALGG